MRVQEFRSSAGQEFSRPGVQEASSSGGQEFRRPRVGHEVSMWLPRVCQEARGRPGVDQVFRRQGVIFQEIVFKEDIVIKSFRGKG